MELGSSLSLENYRAHSPLHTFNFILLTSFMFKAEVNVMLRPAILDVQGKTVENALRSLGYENAGSVRIGKHITLEIEANSHEEAEKVANEISEKVLSNPVMEDYMVSITEIENVEGV